MSTIAENLDKMCKNAAIALETKKNFINALKIEEATEETRTWKLFKDGSILVEEQATQKTCY